MVRKGYRWRIGNGDNFRIGKDNWEVGSHFLCILNHIRNLGTDERVNVLIDQDLHCRKRELVMNHFEFDDAKAVLSIPISGRQVEEKIIWHHEKYGVYSVRSA